MATLSSETAPQQTASARDAGQSGRSWESLPAAALPAVAVLVGVLLSLYHLDRRSIWFDEAASIAFANLDWSAFWSLLQQREANMGLYYLVLKAWLLLGDGEFAVRSLSVVFAVSSIPIIYLIGRRLFDARVALTAAGLLACNAFFIRYAQEARSYSLLLLLVSVSTYFFIKALEEPSGKNWAAYCAVSLLAVYAHFFAGLALIAHAASLPVLCRKGLPWRGILTCAAIIVLGLFPLGIFLATSGSGQLKWIPRPDWLSLPKLFASLAAQKEIPAALGYGVFSFAALVPFLTGRQAADDPAAHRNRLALLIWFGLPIAVVMLVSLVKPVLMPRYMIITLPALILVTALGLADIRNRWLYRACFSGIVMLSLVAVHASYDTEKEPDWRSAARLVTSSAQPHDALIIFNGYNKMPFDYYQRKLDTVSGPLDYVYPSVPTVEHLLGKEREPPDSHRLASLREQNRRVWLMLSGVRMGNYGQFLKNRLGSLYRHRHVEKIDGMELLLFYN